MNADMLATGVELGDRFDFDLVHSHDWLVARAGHHLANRYRRPWVTTIHATEYGRHQGWVDEHPQPYIHGVERWMARGAHRVVTRSHYMRGHVADVYGLEESRLSVIPNGSDPSELVPVDDLDTLRARFAPARRAAGPAGGPGWSTRRASSSRSTPCPARSGGSASCASWWPPRARTRRS